MHIISKSVLTQFWEKHPQSKTSLIVWHKVVTSAHWKNFSDLRCTYASADQVKNFTVFNIGGNKYRLIAFIDYEKQKVFIRHILLHKDYDKNKWKEDPWFQR